MRAYESAVWRELMALDPQSSRAVADALGQGLQTVWPGVAVVGEPQCASEATSTWVWFVTLEGEQLPEQCRAPLVLRIFRLGQEAQAAREGQLCDQLAARGVPVAATHWQGFVGGHPAQLQPRLAGIPAMRVMQGPRLRRVIGDMACLQASLHKVSTSELAAAHQTAADYVRDDLGHRRAAIVALDPSGTWDWICRTATSMATDDMVLCHGDFHPLNVLVDTNGSLSLVDWTDSCIADRHHDVGRTTALYRLASIMADSAAQRVALRGLRRWLIRWHVQGYEATAGVVLDRRRLAWWQTVHTFRSWLQLAELAEGTVIDQGSTTTARIPDSLGATLLADCVTLRKASGR